MTLVERVREDAAVALKAGDRRRVSTLRMVQTELLRAEKEGDGTGEVAILQRERKRRIEAAAAYRDAGREDLADGEESEAAIIEEYMPEQLSDEELGELVGDALAETGASSPTEMGRVMSLVMPKVAGRADGRRVSSAVKEKLTGR